MKATLQFLIQTDPFRAFNLLTLAVFLFSLTVILWPAIQATLRKRLGIATLPLLADALLSCLDHFRFLKTLGEAGFVGPRSPFDMDALTLTPFVWGALSAFVLCVAVGMKFVFEKRRSPRKA